MTVTVKFCGAAGTVTGSSFLVSHPRGRLLVDCGLFQGPKTLRELNYGPFAVDPRGLDVVLLTHAHIDHAGLLPKLCRDGYAGKILATAETNALLEWVLPDSGAIQEGEVHRLNQRNARRGRPPVEPIYTRAQAEATLDRLASAMRDTWIDAAPGVRARFRDAGHILGATSIELEVDTGDAEQRRLHVLFSGDVGPDVKAFTRGPQGGEAFDYVIVEATYGDRERPSLNDVARRDALKNEVLAALAAGGNLIIPAFAIERTQELLSDLIYLMRTKEVPSRPVFLDSPLAARATEVFEQYRRSLRTPLGVDEPFRAPNVGFVASAQESAGLARVTGGAIIIAGSGMCDAGRVRYHLKNNLWRSEATVLFTGYLAPGTLGALIESGAKSVRIHGEEITVNARIRKLDTYSGHADRRELLAWLEARQPIRQGVFIVHGEDAALTSLKRGIVERGVDEHRVVIPRLDQTFVLHPAKAPRAVPPVDKPRLTPVAEAAIRQGRDWHNDYASFVLDLQNTLRGTADERARQALLRRLKRALTSEP